MLYNFDSYENFIYKKPINFKNGTLDYQNKIRWKICKEWLEGADTRELSDKYEFSPEAIRYILRREGVVLYADKIKGPRVAPAQ